MSGGSYEYLCFKDWPEIAEKDHMIAAMRDRLVELGYEDAAAETEEIRLILRQTNVRVTTMLRRLSNVWRAVEWLDSGDSGVDGVKSEVKKYRGEKVDE